MIYTVGHSTHRIEKFIELLRQHDITALADVRSTPYSRRNPQFNRERLSQALAEQGIHYVFLGEELGARSKDPACYEHGRVDYRKLAATSLFQSGIDRLQAGMATQRIALMCAEKEPLDCHRTILVARELEQRGIAVAHILADGAIESHQDAMARLQRSLKLGRQDLFQAGDELLDQAYYIQSQRIAYVDPALKDHN